MDGAVSIDDLYYDIVVLGGGIVGLWTAMEAEAAGLSCCVIEIGGRDLTRADQVAPPLVFPERENLGATRARHHVLTGNSAFWGGALIRNPRSSLARVLGCDMDDPAVAKVEAAYDRVEKILKVSRVGLASPEAPHEMPGLEVQEAIVLPGKRRGLWSKYLEPKRDRNGATLLLTEAHIDGVEFEASGMLRRVRVTQRERGPSHWITGRTFVLSMGVIDSCLFVQDFLAAHMAPVRAAAIGRCLHDHWSVPVAELRWRNGMALSWLFPPKFARQGIIGRRLAFANGFFHVVADYDTMPPYDRVKRLLAARQRGESAQAILRLAAGALARPILMARAGLHYLAKRELLVPDGSPVRLLVDFESAADPENRVVRDGTSASMTWAVRPADERAFHALLCAHCRPLTEIAHAAGIAIHWLIDPTNPAVCSAYLRAKAIDAYHLGGGLAGTAADEDSRVTSATGQLLGTDNVFVMGTASFHTPGVANPVLTLLARASGLIQRFRGSGNITLDNIDGRSPEKKTQVAIGVVNGAAQALRIKTA